MESKRSSIKWKQPGGTGYSGPVYIYLLIFTRLKHALEDWLKTCLSTVVDVRASSLYTCIVAVKKF